MLIERSTCLYCGGCVGVCPTDAMELQEILLYVDEEKCTKCGLCVRYCPVGALKLEK